MDKFQRSMIFKYYGHFQPDIYLSYYHTFSPVQDSSHSCCFVCFYIVNWSSLPLQGITYVHIYILELLHNLVLNHKSNFIFPNVSLFKRPSVYLRSLFSLFSFKSRQISRPGIVNSGFTVTTKPKEFVLFYTYEG